MMNITPTLWFAYAIASLGPKGRNVIAATVRSRLGKVHINGEVRRTGTTVVHVGPSALTYLVGTRRPHGRGYFIPALRASLCLVGDSHPDLTVGAISLRPFGPVQIDCEFEYDKLLFEVSLEPSYGSTISVFLVL